MENTAKTRAMQILSKRDISAREMEKRLIEKGESSETARETVEWLVEIGYIDDSKYAAQIVRHYTAKGYGIHRVKDELYRRGISREIWDEALSELSGTDDAAVAFLEKKLKGSRDKDDLRRASDALCRRGFSYEEAKTAINKYLEAVES